MGAVGWSSRLGKIGPLAVHGRRGRVHHSRLLLLSGRRVEDVERPGDVRKRWRRAAPPPSAAPSAWPPGGRPPPRRVTARVDRRRGSVRSPRMIVEPAVALREGEVGAAARSRSCRARGRDDPRASRRSTRCEPMKPAPPVTRARGWSGHEVRDVPDYGGPPRALSMIRATKAVFAAAHGNSRSGRSFRQRSRPPAFAARLSPPPRRGEWSGRS